MTELPKTISGKIRRVQLRRLEQDRDTTGPFRGIAFDAADVVDGTGARDEAAVEAVPAG